MLPPLRWANPAFCPELFQARRAPNRHDPGNWHPVIGDRHSMSSLDNGEVATEPVPQLPDADVHDSPCGYNTPLHCSHRLPCHSIDIELSRTEDEPVFNTALRQKLETLGLKMPELDIDDVDVDGIIRALTNTIQGRAG